MRIDTENAFPPFSLATASSEAVLAGCDQPLEQEQTGTLEQQIPVGTQELHTISAFLNNRNQQSTIISGRVFAGGRILREMQVTLPPGREWTEFRVGLSPLAGTKIGEYVRLQLDLPNGVFWIESEPNPAFPGTGAQDAPATFCFRLSPPQPCFWPTNVLPETEGSNRFTGIWKSDPQKPFPQWLDISWKDPMNLRGLRLEFPDALQAPEQYRVEAFALNETSQSVEIAQNQLQAATHLFDSPIAADRVRFTVYKTRGAPSVAVSRVTPI